MADVKREVLQAIRFGERVAEEEAPDLARYFVETNEWRRLFNGDVDVVYGPKGAGKSALYSLLLKRSADLAARGIVVVAAENPRGTTAFQELVADPPPTETEFVLLWKMYFLSLVGDLLRREGLDDVDGRIVIDALENAELMKHEKSLRNLLRVVADYVRRLLPKGLEGEVKVDPDSGGVIGFAGRITLQEPNAEDAKRGLVSVHALFEAAGRSLAKAGKILWLLTDRLDVAFAESPPLEENALRALFKTYLDLHGEDAVRLKIFLRTDIWRRITSGGFREASHITRTLTIRWDRPSLLNLIVRRAIGNEPLRAFYDVNAEDALSSGEERLKFFFRIFYDQVEVGPNKSDTVDWILSRTRDGTRETAPREVVHLLNTACAVQSKKLELGEASPEGERLFARPTLKDALPEVSRVRLEQTIYAEYATLKTRIEALRKEKSKHTAKSLARVWDLDESGASLAAEELVDIGIFEPRGTKTAPEFWIPFLYRDALDISQGTADDA